MLGQKLGLRSTRHNAVRHDGQLVTRFYGVTSLLAPGAAAAKLNPAHADYIVFCQRRTVNRRQRGKTDATLTPGGRCFRGNCNAWMGLQMLPSFTQYS